MKRYLILAVAVIMFMAMSAQGFKSADKKYYWGIRVSVGPDFMVMNKEVSTFSQSKMVTGTSASIGVMYQMPLIANMYFEPGVSMYYSNHALTALDNSTKIHIFGFNIPLVLGYHYDFNSADRMALITGAVVNYGTWGREEITGNYDDSRTADLFEDGFRRLQIDWRVGVAYTHKHFTYSLYTDIDINNMTPDNENDLKTRFHKLQFSVGYYFNGSKF